MFSCDDCYFIFDKLSVEVDTESYEANGERFSEVYTTEVCPCCGGTNFNEVNDDGDDV